MRMQHMHPHFYYRSIQLYCVGRAAHCPIKGGSAVTECITCSRELSTRRSERPSSEKHCRLLSSYLFNLERGR